MVTSPTGLGTEKDYAGEGRLHIQKHTRPLVREGAPEKQDRKCQTVINTGHVPELKKLNVRLRIVLSFGM
jgi:hypothetical protein